MAYISELFKENFLEYASYVIKERAIPHLNDGLKPVQRRILQSLYDVDDGKFHKVANVVGHAMQYHPHGDASIYEALVNLSNKELFIDKQGNFGNPVTGDPASAARYIESRLLPLAKEVLFKPEITAFAPSYDGRRKEPITLPAKIPLPLILGSEGIAVGMATRILPHNFVEVLEAEQACLKKEPFELFPDIASGGFLDVSHYKEGNGKILSRARIDISDPKRVVIREIPCGTTTESLISSIEAAARSNKIKIGSIDDYTTEEVEIEIKLPRGVHANDILDGLYAFSDCEMSISVNMLLVCDERPMLMKVPEIIEHYASSLLQILEQELLLEKKELGDTIHIRTLEKIFIVEKIYKRLESVKTIKGIFRTVRQGFAPFQKEIKRELHDDDIEHLLKIPIRRISLFDIERMEDDIARLEGYLRDVEKKLGNLVLYAIAFLDGILDKYRNQYPRQSEILRIEKVDIREAAQKNLKIKYNPDTGYLGHDVSGGRVLYDASVYNRILYVRKDGSYTITDVPGKLFVGKGMLYSSLAEKEVLESLIFSLVYRHGDNNYPYIKRCRISQYILNRRYSLVPQQGKIIRLTVKEDVAVVMDFKQKSLLPKTDQFPLSNYLIKGVKAQGVRLKAKEFLSARFVSLKTLQK